MSTKEMLQKKLENVFHPTVLKIFNESQYHRGHKETLNNKKDTHFHLILVSNSFQKMTLLKRHRMVYKAITKNFLEQSKIHSLKIKTYTPEEYQLLIKEGKGAVS